MSSQVDVLYLAPPWGGVDYAAGRQDFNLETMVRPSARPSIRPSVRPSVRPFVRELVSFNTPAAGCFHVSRPSRWT